MVDQDPKEITFSSSLVSLLAGTVRSGVTFGLNSKIEGWFLKASHGRHTCVRMTWESDRPRV